jgi:hypothetical protein
MSERFYKPLLILIAFLPFIYLNCLIDRGRWCAPFQATNVAMALVCIFRVFPLTKPCRITTDCVTEIFIYIFMTFAPLCQYVYNANLWGGQHLTGDDYFFAQLVYFIGYGIYIVAYNYLYKRRIMRSTSGANDIATYSTSSRRVHRNTPLMLTLFSTAFTLWMYHSSPILLFFREFEDASAEFLGNSSLQLLLSLVIRPMPILITALYLLYCKKLRWQFWPILICGIITNFPLSLARFYVAGVYIPLMFALFKRLIHRPILFRALLIFGILYVFPFLNQGRTVSDTDEISWDITPSYKTFCEGHYDSFQNGAKVIVRDITTNGQQLLGCLFFWVPRSIWHTKPIGSGGFIAKRLHLMFDHISVNYWAEGWVNFGIFGVILFSFILAMINAKYDYRFWHIKTDTLFGYRYLLYIGMIIFILRGDLISSVAYIVGLLVSAWICAAAFTKGKYKVI